MRIDYISFENYKAFKEKQVIKLKPITLLIGKNSSGKSAIAKLLTLLENSLSGKIEEPIRLTNNNVELGGDYVDVVYGKNPFTPVMFSVQFTDGAKVSVSLIQEVGKYDVTIFEWSCETPETKFAIRFSPEVGYIDDKGKKFKCRFRGFVPIEIIDETGINLVSSMGLNTAFDVDYVGPFRILPERQFYLSGQISYDNVGVQGENAYSMLAVSKIMKTELNEKVGKWYEDHFDGWKLVTEDKNRPFIQLQLCKEGVDINIVDVGQGMNQALPLVVRANLKKSDSIVVLEQPELHLHPAAHGDLIELFAESSKEGNQSFVIETHSENMLSRLRRLVVENKSGLTVNDVVIYWVHDSDTQGQFVTEITITDQGILTDWPEGVFTENTAEIIELRKAVIRKRG